MIIVILALTILVETFGAGFLFVWMLKTWHKEVNGLNAARLRDAMLTPPEVFGGTADLRPETVPVTEEKTPILGSGIADVMSSVFKFRDHIIEQEKKANRPPAIEEAQ